jgi:hypothetical protein
MSLLDYKFALPKYALTGEVYAQNSVQYESKRYEFFPGSLHISKSFS